MRILYFDCFSGISGDMILGALVDAGLPPESLLCELEKLGLGGYKVTFETVTGVGSLGGTRARVAIEKSGAARHLPEILELIRESGLGDRVKQRACAIFQRLGEAEAAVHGVSVEKIHFHEVGALDAIVDIVGAAAGLELLAVDRVYSCKLHFGTGTVECQHGTLPVPVPAVVRLAEGFPCRYTNLEGELTTPTGAAILTTAAHKVGVEIDMVPEKVGYGFGTRERKGLPNALRVVLGRAADEAAVDSAVLLETNLDDVTGQVLGFLMERCFEAGALDVFYTPIQMKKNRPGFQVSVLCSEDALEPVRNTLAGETGTLGVRITRVSRAVAPRRFETLSTSLGEVRVKRSAFPGLPDRISAEYEDLARLAREKGLPLRIVRETIEKEIDRST